MVGWRENQRTGKEQPRQCVWVILRVRFLFGESDVPGRPDELSELCVGNGRSVDPEAVDGYAMNRCLFWIMLVRTHEECAPWNPDKIIAFSIMLVPNGGAGVCMTRIRCHATHRKIAQTRYAVAAGRYIPRDAMRVEAHKRILSRMWPLGALLAVSSAVFLDWLAQPYG